METKPYVRTEMLVILLTYMETRLEVVASSTISYSYGQFDILRSILRQKLKAVARVARRHQYLRHVAILFQSMPLATRATFWFHNLCNIRKKCCVSSTSKNDPRVAAA